jgi:hypothetical protein
VFLSGEHLLVASHATGKVQKWTYAGNFVGDWWGGSMPRKMLHLPELDPVQIAVTDDASQAVQFLAEGGGGREGDGAVVVGEIELPNTGYYPVDVRRVFGEDKVIIVGMKLAVTDFGSEPRIYIACIPGAAECEGEGADGPDKIMQ